MKGTLEKRMKKIETNREIKKNLYSNKKYKKSDINKIVKERIESYRMNRIDALNIIGKGTIKCFNCGCDKLDILEINHVRGDGYKDKRRNLVTNDIVDGKRKISDFNILCKVCNIAHFVNHRYGIEYNIIWVKKNG